MMELPTSPRLLFARIGLGDLLPAHCRGVLIVSQNKLQASSQPKPDIPRLTAQMATGDEDAYRQFYDLYFNRLLRYLLVVTGNEDSAREALQSTLLRVTRNARKFESEAAFWSWLTVLDRSSVADQGRRLRRYLAFLDRFFQQKQIETAPAEDQAGARLLELLERNLAALPMEERELLERKYFERQSVHDLAEQMQLTEKALDSRLVRIRRRLKNMILEEISREK